MSFFHRSVLEQEITPGADRWTELAGAIRRGDPEAVAEFTRTYLPSVRSMVGRRLSSESADRVAGDVIVRAIKDIRGGWIRTVRDFLACAHREIAIEQESNPSDPGPNASGRAWVAVDRIEQVLASMQPQERRAVTLFLLEGKTVEEAMAATGVSDAQLSSAKALVMAAMDEPKTRKPPVRESWSLRHAKRASV